MKDECCIVLCVTIYFAIVIGTSANGYFLYLFLFKCVNHCVYATSAHEGQKWVSDHLELELQAVCKSPDQDAGN